MKVKCPNCKRMDFVTTEKYDPNVTPNGSFVKCLLPFQIDWLTISTTLVSEMACPHCLAQLAPAGRLIVVPDPDPIEDTLKDLGADPLSTTNESEPAGQSGDAPSPFTCPICEREFKTKAALNGHQRWHKEAGK